MFSLDTNVLVRIFVDDPDMPQQTEQARRQVSQLKQVYVTHIVEENIRFISARKATRKEEEMYA